MKWRLTAGLVAVAGCNQAETNEQQVGAESQAVQPANAGGVDAGSEVPDAARQPNEISSGMPVPGTNTPEHVVENQQTIANNINGL